jgi:hypothetical protein
MYGLVNKGIEDLIVSRFGEPCWEAIKRQAGVDVDAFVSMEAYSDEVTYRLIGAASEVLGVPANSVIETFGEFWILFTAGEGYGPLLDMAGHDLASFIQRLDEMHTRVGVTLPKLQPPSFWCTDVATDSLRLHYHTQRTGLAPLVVGIIKGLGKRFGAHVDIIHVVRREDGADHDEFLVRHAKA